MTMVNWFMVTSRPRTAAGAISAMYMGERFEASPMAMPPAIRQRLKAVNESTSAVPSDETTKTNAGEDQQPLAAEAVAEAAREMAPIRQPTSALPIAQPSCQAVATLKNRS